MACQRHVDLDERQAAEVARRPLRGRVSNFELGNSSESPVLQDADSQMLGSEGPESEATGCHTVGSLSLTSITTVSPFLLSRAAT